MSRVRTADAGVTDTYLGTVPAEEFLLVGILGHISNTDLAPDRRRCIGENLKIKVHSGTSGHGGVVVS